MKFLSRRHCYCFGLLVATLISGVAQAQTDRVYPQGGDAVIGRIKSLGKNEIVISVAGKDQSFPANEITRILFQGDPPELTRGRELVMEGQYEQAFDELKQLNIAELSRDVIKADAEFYLAETQGQMALSGQGDLNKATSGVIAFAQAHPDSWHFYDATRLLGDLAKALGNYEKAAQFYGYLRNAPARELQIEAVYQTGMIQLLQDNLGPAKAALSKVAGLKPNTAGEKRLQTLSQAGIAVITAKQGQGEEALKAVNDLIATLNPIDTQTAAAIYNAQGASYQALGDEEGALLAYLHTQLMYSSHAAEHVEALKQLVDLWTKVGKPDRAAQARGELQQRYPGLSS
ncbi:tetratricopeptide repeat protein [Allorhodopirellula solitaria]|uniref:Tetratricopeptide repeat protein n=1 Tax=Allorhodopirellula solitaria TaxID=2527987 RepID=A0A5C5XTH6_9BACT|nr:hypothetical protein [Allorhodopirellula solitaria]TWT66174.1 hypothetical protein CA85_30380 [Allorhodopirellula solitaria]